MAAPPRSLNGPAGPDPVSDYRVPVTGRATSGGPADHPAGMPDVVEPMLVGSGEFPGGPDWTVEFAWEGLRVLAYVTAQGVRLRSSSGRSLSGVFPDLEAALHHTAPIGGVILDGTVVAQGPTGTPRRRALQTRSGRSHPSDGLIRRVPVAFLVGDVLWHGGRSTLDLPQRRRRELGEDLRLEDPAVLMTPAFPATELGPVMHAADQHGLDALHARQVDAPYRPGRRSKHFLRVPVRRVRQVVVGGFSPADPRRPQTAIGALLLGVPEVGGLRYVGRAGLRTAVDRSAVADALAHLRRADSPFTAPLPVEVAEHAVWMAPQLVGRVEYADRMPDGRLRLPIWRGQVTKDEIDAARFVQIPRPPTAPPATVAGEAPPRSSTEAAPPAGIESPVRRRLEQHFFYNSLNTIAAVIRTDPGHARDLLLGFAELNRAADRATPTTTLGDELDAVRAYLKLEQARFGARLRTDLDVDAALHGHSVTPMALLEAVRTTVQDHIEPRPGGGMLVLRASAGVCTVAVDGDPPHATVALLATG
jgi:hypothetical protein